MEKQENIPQLDISYMRITELAAVNLIDVHFSKVENLSKFPYELFNRNSFLKSDENIEKLCECIKK